MCLGLRSKRGALHNALVPDARRDAQLAAAAREWLGALNDKRPLYEREALLRAGPDFVASLLQAYWRVYAQLQEAHATSTHPYWVSKPTDTAPLPAIDDTGDLYPTGDF